MPIEDQPQLPHFPLNIVPTDVVPYDRQPGVLPALQKALRSDRPVSILWPGEVQLDDDGIPTAVALARTVGVGEVIVLDEEWRLKPSAGGLFTVVRE